MFQKGYKKVKDFICREIGVFHKKKVKPERRYIGLEITIFKFFSSVFCIAFDD